MAAALFALATLALALWAPRARTLATPGGLALALGVGGAAGVALGVFERVGAGVPPTAQAPFFLLAALAALALWGALAVLAFHQVRRRDAF